MENLDTNLAVIEADGPNDCFVPTLRGVLQNGDKVASRGMNTREIHPALMIFLKPRERFLMCAGRNIHPYFQVMESIWILGGRGDVKWISKYLGNMEKYSDGEKEFHGSYGHRMRHYGYLRSIEGEKTIIDPIGEHFFRDQFRNCYEYLKKDPETRHAIMSFWNPNFDHIKIKTNDRPCNITFHFLIRDGKLDLTIFNRSNDVVWGLFNTNIVQFSVILETMAMLLKIPVGRQIHMIDSLHVYEDNPNAEELFCAEDSLVKRILDKNPLDKDQFNIYDHISPYPFSLTIPESQVDDLKVLDEDLKRFFRQEEKIWSEKGPFFIVDYNFSFLKDALSVANSFFYYKKEDYHLAIENLSGIKADDIFISCLEFVARKATGERLTNYIEEEFAERFHFPNCEGDKISAILSYVFGH